MALNKSLSWKKYSPKRDNILLILHEIQNNNPFNYIPERQIRSVAEYIDIPLSEIHGILSFYSIFSTKPRGKFVIKFCDSVSCRIQGSLDIYSHLRKMLGIKKNQTTSDRLFTLEAVNCFGSCDTAPNLMVNDILHTNLDKEHIDKLIRDLQTEAANENSKISQ